MAGRHFSGGRQPPRQQPFAVHLIAAHQREIHQLLTDQEEMLDQHTHLKQDLAALHDELHTLAGTTRELTHQRDAKINELYNKSVKLEAEVAAIEDLRFEHAQVLSDVERLKESNVKFEGELKSFEEELCRVKDEGNHVGVVKSDVENMKKEIKKGRAAVDFEKKTRLANLELSEAMEKKKNSMQYEIEMLRAELSNAEKRARAAAAAASNPNPGYMGNYGSHSMAYGGGPYSVQYYMHQGQLTPDVPPPVLYGRPGGSYGPHGPLDTQPHHVPKG